LDEDFNMFLIEVNTNPCLEESSNLLKTLLPRMLEDMFKLTVDAVFPKSSIRKPKRGEKTINKMGSTVTKSPAKAVTSSPVKRISTAGKLARSATTKDQTSSSTHENELTTATNGL